MAVSSTNLQFIMTYLVVLEDGELDLPVLVLDLLGGGVVLLLPLLGATPVKTGMRTRLNKN